MRQGRHSLSNAELLAIFLRMGIKGKMCWTCLPT
ncbi:MAG: UPF0758 domain-containing protein [Akkermansia sp.]